MIIEPKVREYICTTAHPQGCAESVRNQADHACKQGTVNGTKDRSLIIGCSTGYGRCMRICYTGIRTAELIPWELCLNVRRMAEERQHRDGTIQQNFTVWRQKRGLYAKTINGDAFSKEIKDKAIELIKKDLGKVDLVVYSLAAREEAYGCGWKDMVILSENYRRSVYREES